MEITLSPAAAAKIRKPVNGQGGFQTLLRRLQRQLAGNVLTVSEADFGRMVKYTVDYGRGGFQTRTAGSSGRRVAANAKKKR